ncbi:hypothetical protein [Mycoplasmoides alvi]|uniref:hypothetical protein n=1 Tax=Mycoplasmoides alvi TaxID=78580 RepID=UPI00051BFD8F|nr:hypothetical protein [Mycoplasmoides alvi]
MINSSWNPSSYLKDKIYSIRSRIGQNYVICLVNYDLNSAILATILRQALGHQVLFVHIDTGLISEDEKTKVSNLFEKILNLKLITIKANDAFWTNISQTMGLQNQLATITNTFIDVLSKTMYDLNLPIYCISDGTFFNNVYNESKEIYLQYMQSLKELNLLILQPLRNLTKEQLVELGNFFNLPFEVMETQWMPIYGSSIFLENTDISRIKIDLFNKIQSIYEKEMHKNHFLKFNTVCVVNFLSDDYEYNKKFDISLKAINLIEKNVNANILDLSTSFWKHLSNQIKSNIPIVNKILLDLN